MEYYAIDSNAALSSGTLNGNVDTRLLHGAQCDITTGKKIKEPDLAGPSAEGLSDAMKKYIEYAYILLRDIKVHDQEKFGLLIDCDRIKIKPATTSAEQWL
jgi:hypothetical protein